MIAALLIDLAWKSGLIAAVALIGAALLHARPARERVAFLRLGVVLLLALPLLTVLVPSLRLQTPAALAPRIEQISDRPALAPSPAAPPARATTAVAPPIPGGDISTAPALPGPSTTQLILGVYALGVAGLLLHLGIGVAALGRWTRRARPVSDPRWLAALDRAAGARRRPILLASSHIRSPLSWGWRPGIILVNPDALPAADRADAVMAHEMGHVRHADWPFLMLSRALVALLWFNPLVWLLQRELSRQSEQAADAWAIGRVDRADYAQALVAMARDSRPQAALGMAPSRNELARRVTAVLTRGAAGGRPWPTALAAVACIAFATPLAAVEWAPGAPGAVNALLPAPPRPAPVSASGAAPSPAFSEEARAPVEGVTPPVPAASPNRPDEQPEGDQGAPTPIPAPMPMPPPDDPFAVVLRQRDQKLALMEASATLMEHRVGQMRNVARTAPMGFGDRQKLISDAAGLENDARSLRAQARDRAAKEPAALPLLTSAEERQLADDMRQVLAEPSGLGD